MVSGSEIYSYCNHYQEVIQMNGYSPQSHREHRERLNLVNLCVLCGSVVRKTWGQILLYYNFSECAILHIVPDSLLFISFMEQI